MKIHAAPTLADKTDDEQTDLFSRRKFFRWSAVAAAGLAIGPRLSSQEKPGQEKPKPAKPPEITTNVDQARAIPRVATSMPGLYPGAVVRVDTGRTSVEGKADAAKVRAALNRGLVELMEAKSVSAAWMRLVKPADVVGIKVNPIGGKLLSTKPEVVDVIIEGLVSAGVPKTNIIIWDRRHFQLADAGFTEARFPGIRILGTEMKGPNNDFFDPKGELWSKDNIDRAALPFTASVEDKYDRETLPYMINEGKDSYFTKLATTVCTKIVNVPVLKNAGPTVTACLKNLSFGSISNTGRLHKLWMKAVAEPCAFPCIRDKVVLNIVDGLQACFDGGPAADPRFIWDANVMFLGTDPVAVDAVCHDYIIAERIKRGKQKTDEPRMSEFLTDRGGVGAGRGDEREDQGEGGPERHACPAAPGNGRRRCPTKLANPSICRVS